MRGPFDKGFLGDFETDIALAFVAVRPLWGRHGFGSAHGPKPPAMPGDALLYPEPVEGLLRMTMLSFRMETIELIDMTSELFLCWS